MNILVYETYEKMSKAAADLIAAQIMKKPQTRIGLTAGNTPLGLYQELVDRFEAGLIDFSESRFYNLEEVVGYGPDSPESYRAVMRKLLLDRIKARPEQAWLPNGLAEDIARECAAFDAELKGLDIQILGLGLDGHIGCNNPGEVLSGPCHQVNLSRGRRGIAMGMKSIMGAKCLIMLANGADKAKAVENMCQGSITAQCPSTFLQLHSNAFVLLDQAAAIHLK